MTIIPQWIYWIAIGALVLMVGGQQVRVSNAKAETAQVRQEFAQAREVAALQSQKAEQDARAEEQRREAEKERIAHEADERTKLAEAAARDASDSAERLRQRVAALISQAGRASTNPSTAKPGAGVKDIAALDLLSGVLSRADSASGELAAYADRLYVAGFACERFVDGLQAK